jgi:hypothetical protein
MEVSARSEEVEIISPGQRQTNKKNECGQLWDVCRRSCSLLSATVVRGWIDKRR